MEVGGELWLPGGHAQTIWPALWARRTLGPPPAYVRERWLAPDGDFVDVDFLWPCAAAGAAPAPLLPRPVVVMLGLAAALIVVVGLRGLSDIVGPTFLALVLTVAAHPLRPWVARLGAASKQGDVDPNFLRAGVVKVFADGVMEYPAQTAALLAPYLEAGGKPTKTTGELSFDPEHFAHLVQKLDAAGLTVHIHAIGDVVHGDGPVCQLDILGGQRFHGVGEHVLDVAAHPAQLLLERGELGIKALS